MATLQIKVKPNARVSSLEQAADGSWLARLKAPPVDGQANEELIALVARQFACRKAAVSIKSGGSGRMKLVKIDDASRKHGTACHALLLLQGVAGERGKA